MQTRKLAVGYLARSAEDLHQVSPDENRLSQLQDREYAAGGRSKMAKKQLKLWKGQEGAGTSLE